MYCVLVSSHLNYLLVLPPSFSFLSLHLFPSFVIMRALNFSSLPIFILVFFLSLSLSRICRFVTLLPITLSPLFHLPSCSFTLFSSLSVLLHLTPVGRHYSASRPETLQTSFRSRLRRRWNFPREGGREAEGLLPVNTHISSPSKLSA